MRDPRRRAAPQVEMMAPRKLRVQHLGRRWHAACLASVVRLGAALPGMEVRTVSEVEHGAAQHSTAKLCCRGCATDVARHN